jgi:hypothetical protein
VKCKKRRKRELTELSNELASGDKAEKQVDVGVETGIEGNQAERLN